MRPRGRPRRVQPPPRPGLSRFELLLLIGCGLEFSILLLVTGFFRPLG